jgi:SOS response regulatory protein OraA/RecX
MSDDPEYIALEKMVKKGVLYHLSFSNDYEVRVGGGTVQKLGLVEKQEFDPGEFEKLRAILDREYAYFVAESQLARRGFSIGEFKQRLRQKEIPEPFIARIVSDYRGLGLLNDEKYAEIRVRSLLERKPAGRGFLIAELQKRLVPRNIAEKVVAAALDGVDEVETALKLLARKQAVLAKFDIDTARRKAYTYLSRRAISFRAAKTAFDRIFGSKA